MPKRPPKTAAGKIDFRTTTSVVVLRDVSYEDVLSRSNSALLQVQLTSTERSTFESFGTLQCIGGGALFPIVCSSASSRPLGEGIEKSFNK